MLAHSIKNLLEKGYQVKIRATPLEGIEVTVSKSWNRPSYFSIISVDEIYVYGDLDKALESCLDEAFQELKRIEERGTKKLSVPQEAKDHPRPPRYILSREDGCRKECDSQSPQMGNAQQSATGEVHKERSE